MINEFINEALNKAKFELIDNKNIYNGEVTELAAFGPPENLWKNAVVI
jgi:hypothetical protein